jgi:hypothetical protein
LPLPGAFAGYDTLEGEVVAWLRCTEESQRVAYFRPPQNAGRR